MRIGSSIALIAVGAVLTFAVSAEIPYVDLDLVGYILMAAGVIGLIWVLLTASRRRVTQTRAVHDPATGESIRRTETNDGL